MASSGGGGGDVPAERAAAAVNDLREAQEGAERLRVWLQDQSSEWTELMDVMLNKLTSALSALDTGCAAGASAAGSGDGALKPTAESSARRTRKRSSSRRSQRSSSTRVTHTLTDGHIWQKYGQKDIQNSPNPRSYYRCTHKTDRGCDARRQVQACETDPSKYTITYYGEHTCTTAPRMIIVDANHDRERNNLVSFARTFPQLATKNRGCDARRQVQACETDPSKYTITYYGEHTCTTAPRMIIVDANHDRERNNLVSFARTFPQLATNEGGAATTQHLSSSWCTSDGVFSSLGADPFVQTDELAVVVGSAGRTSSTVGSMPDYGGLGEMAGGGQGGGNGSFHSSPSSVEFVMSPLDSFGDDDFFRCDP